MTITGQNLVRIAVTFKALQVGAEFASALVTDVAVFFERRVDNAIAFGWETGIKSNDGNGRLMQDGVKNCCRAVASER